MSTVLFLDRFFSLSYWFAQVTKLGSFEQDRKVSSFFFSLFSIFFYFKAYHEISAKTAIEAFLDATANGYQFCRLLFVLNPISIRISAANAKTKNIFGTRYFKFTKIYYD
jgi:hypothetical protein